MYPLGIDDRLETTPLCGISSFASSPYPRGPTIVTNLEWTLHHASIVEQGLGVHCLVSKLSRPSPRCSSLSDVDLREHVDRSFLVRILSDRWPPVREQSALYHMSFACVHRVLREVCVRFRYLLPFPSLSHRFDHEIHKDRAPKRLTPPSSGISSFWLPRISHRFGLFPINSKIPPKIAPIRVLDRSVI